MNRQQFLQEARPMMDVVDAMFGKMFAPEKFGRVIPNSERPHVKVTFEGIEFCVAGNYQPADLEVGISVSEYMPEVIWMASDPECNDLSDFLKGITIDDLADRACESYEAQQRGEIEYQLEERARRIEEEAAAERE